MCAAGHQRESEPKTHNFPFDRLGVRVPALVASPYVPAGTIDHTQYHHTSILKTVDNVPGLNGSLNLTPRVRAAADFSKMLALPAARPDIPTCPSPIAAFNVRIWFQLVRTSCSSLSSGM
ncbi:alkaline phosphatase family protein [Paraburkholderia dilworthii]|uniref:alkaline phosphatase family protein n=1 Tax=Paraburkholderia dilworthii TaxID=948106 RepID=UPI0009FBD3CB